MSDRIDREELMRLVVQRTCDNAEMVENVVPGCGFNVVTGSIAYARSAAGLFEKGHAPGFRLPSPRSLCLPPGCAPPPTGTSPGNWSFTIRLNIASG
jgi:hypothetical protein